MWIRLLKPVDDKKVNDFLDVEETVARAYIGAGLAKEEAEGPERHLLKEARDAYFEELRSFAKDTATELREAAKGLKRPGVGAGGVEVLQDEADKTRSIGDHVRQVYFAADSSNPERQAAAHERLVKVYGVTRGMTEGGGASGGYTTGVTYESQILEVAAEDSVITPGAMAVPLGNRTVEWPALDQYQAPSAGQSAMFGGVQVFRKGEATQRTQTQPKYTKVALNAGDITAYTEISRDLLNDSNAALDAMVPRLFGAALGWRIDWECLNGTGSGQFLGIYNAPCTISITRNTGATIKYQDIFTMYTRMLSESKKRGVWVCHPYTIAALMQIQDPGGRFAMLPYYTPAEGAMQGAPTYRMLGLPVLETEKAPVLGSAGDLLLADRLRYLYGTRSGLEIGVSEHFKFDTDQVAMRAKVRNDGQPQLKRAITLADGSSTVSAFVQLL